MYCSKLRKLFFWSKIKKELSINPLNIIVNIRKWIIKIIIWNIFREKWNIKKAKIYYNEALELLQILLFVCNLSKNEETIISRNLEKVKSYLYALS